MNTIEDVNYTSSYSNPNKISWESNDTRRYEDSSVNYFHVNPSLVHFVKNKLKDSRWDFTDHYLYFCSTINYLHYVDKRYKDKEFVPINYKTMVSVISKDKYAEIVSDLIEWGIIEVNGSYRVDYYSKGYKLLPPYDTGIKRVKIRDMKINNKINRFRMRSYKELRNLPEAYQYLSMTNTWIEIDRRRAYYYNTRTYLSQQDTYNSNYYSISAYADGDYRFTVDATGYRAHTNITNLKKDFRKFLSVDRERLGQVDIKNSQPLFFYLHIKDNPNISEDEKERYRNIVEEGKFYEFFMEKLEIPFDKRSSIKTKILAAVFFDMNRTEASRYVKIMESDFPSIAKYISEVKKDDYKTLARILQRTESSFVIGKVVSEFIDRFGDSSEFISTIHDSIVVKSSMLQKAEEVMRFCFEKEGLKPQLAISKFYQNEIII